MEQDIKLCYNMSVFPAKDLFEGKTPTVNREDKQEFICSLQEKESDYNRKQSKTFIFRPI